jgi:hypothetical protein
MLLARSYDMQLLKLTIRDKSDGSPASPGSGEKKAPTVRTEVFPPIPITQYEKMVQDIESIAAMGLAPLAWNADRTLAPENAAQVGNAVKIWAAMADLDVIQAFWEPKDGDHGTIPRVSLDLGLGENGYSGKYWLPTLPSNASKERLKASIDKVREILKTLPKQTVPAAERTRLWKSLPAEVAPVLALFRQYCAPAHIWMFPFKTKTLLFEKSIHLGDGTRVFYSGTFHP